MITQSKILNRSTMCLVRSVQLWRFHRHSTYISSGRRHTARGGVQWRNCCVSLSSGTDVCQRTAPSLRCRRYIWRPADTSWFSGQYTV